jgi:hypothetical protein
MTICPAVVNTAQLSILWSVVFFDCTAVIDSHTAPVTDALSSPMSNGLNVSQHDLPTGINVPPARRDWRLWLCLVLLVGLGFAVRGVLNELETSKRLAPRLAQYTKTLTYSVQPGPSDAMHYPVQGPFDARLGYVKLPVMLERLRSRGMQIEAQAEYTPAMTCSRLMPKRPRPDCT